MYITDKSFDNNNYSTNPLVKGEYEYCTFKNCDFSGSDLSEIKFIEATFVDCNLSNTRIAKTAFQVVSFKGCKMLGLAFETANSLGFEASFERCQLNHSVFFQMNLKHCSFLNSQLHEADFGEADLPKVTLKNCDLLNASFDRTNLEGANLTQSFNYSIDPEINRIKGAKFSLPDVIGLLAKYDISVD